MSETTLSFQDMLNKAQEAGGTSEAPPPGEYVGVAVSAAAKRSKSGKVEIGIKLRVEEGALKGAGIWSNQYLSPDSPVALDIWFQTFEAFGIPRDWWGQFGANLDQAAAQASEYVKGKTVKFVVGNEEWPKNSGTFNPRVKRISRVVPGQAAAPTTAGPQPPTVPAAPAGPTPPGPPAPPKAPF